MNKKEHQIWQEFKYDEYLFYQHIFSYEKQLKSQGKMVLDYVVHDSDEANKIFDDLFNEHKKLKKSKININPYNNKNHPIWSFYDPLLYDDNYCESLLNRLCKFSHKHLKFYPQILSKNEPWLHSNFGWA